AQTVPRGTRPDAGRTESREVAGPETEVQGGSVQGTAGVTTAVAERKRKAKPPDPDDPVTAYAKAVTAGQVTAGRGVRQACQRHLDDVARQSSEGFPYRFDVKAARAIIEFFPMFLSLETGEPFSLVGWQRFCLGSV